MRYSPINKVLFENNRARLHKELAPKSMAVLHANDILPTNADGVMPFHQNADLFYLSGIDQEESILIVFPDAKEEDFREVLFLRETNEHIAIWEGHKYTKEEARNTSGIQTIFWLSEFPRVFNTLITEAENVYLNTNEHLRAEVVVETRDARFVKWCQEKYPLHTYKRLAPIMHYLRAVKSEEEIALIQQACDITEKGFRRVLAFTKPGVHEFEIEAEYVHEFIRNRSKGFAYSPIVASGANACVLHYIDNNQVCKEGELILMDVGASYANYAADMTRCIPVSGRFTERQKAVYEAVLRVMKYALGELRVGNNLQDYHTSVGEAMTKELVDLKLLTQEEVKAQNPKHPAYKKYFMHGTSHHLGLDVHDVGDKYRTFEEGMVFTCEPGIYIREEGLGIRLENDVVIRKEGIEDLMEYIPFEKEAIEELMNQ